MAIPIYLILSPTGKTLYGLKYKAHKQNCNRATSEKISMFAIKAITGCFI